MVALRAERVVVYAYDFWELTLRIHGLSVPTFLEDAWSKRLLTESLVHMVPVLDLAPRVRPVLSL